MKSALLQFAVAKGIGDVSLKRAIAFVEESGYSWEDLCSSSELLQSELHLKADVVQNIKSAKIKAQEIFDSLSEKGISILVENDDTYPQYLKKILLDKCPPLLFVKGNTSLLKQPAVGFCGSRKVSSKGLTIASDCAKQLAEKDIVVISGFAAGTDLSAHRSALASGGNTVFVLAEGILKTSIKVEITYKTVTQKCGDGFVFVIFKRVQVCYSAFIKAARVSLASPKRRVVFFCL